MKGLVFYFLIINIITFFLFGYDKRKSVKRAYRISEKALLVFSIGGGCFGGLLAMKLFRHKTQKKTFSIGLPVLCILFVLGIISYSILDFLCLLPEKSYTAKDFGIEVVKSDIDYNQNGIDDYTDILLGAKMEANRNPKYKSTYYAGGYAPLSEGVCTDVVIRSLLNAGYSLKDMIDQDIKENVELYPRVENHPDPNIDFRRVKNLKVFFDRMVESHTLSLSKIDDWQPGDIVIFGKDYTHIGIVSDKRNENGVPYLIHNAGQPNKEENSLERWAKWKTITGHYRFRLVKELS